MKEQGKEHFQNASEEVFELIVCPTNEQNPRNSEADILPLKDGSLLLAYSEFYAGDANDHASARISGKISEDGGKTWSEPFVLQENIGKLNVMSASLLRLKSGEILLFYCQKNSLSDCRPCVKVSVDEGKSWSEPICCTDSVAYFCVNNARAVQLSSGRILLPASYTTDVGKVYHFKSFCFYSDDKGKTWRRSVNEIDLPSVGADEPGVVELKDGKVLMVIRTNLGQIYKSISRDGGVTWSPAEPMGLTSPEAPCTITRIPSTGDLLIIWNNSPKNRVPLTSAISRDEGKSWGNIKDLETTGEGYAYTSITFVGERVLLTYYAQISGRWNLKLKSLPVKWFYR